MTVIGLTGGIAAGKSTAAEVLSELGAVIIDADRLGHRSYEPGTPGFQKVVNAFGHDIVSADGTIDRRILGGKVFGAPGQLERLNKIVWPEIRTLIKEDIKQIRQQEDDPIIVLEAAVLLEAGWQDLCDEIWVVTTPVKTAVDRLKSRNGLSEDAAMARISAQMSNKERAEQADVKLENNSTEDQLRARVERAWKALLTRRRRAANAGGAKAGGGKATKTGSRKAASGSAKASTASSAKSSTKAASKPAARSSTTKASGTSASSSKKSATTSRAAKSKTAKTSKTSTASKSTAGASTSKASKSDAKTGSRRSASSARSK